MIRITIKFGTSPKYRRFVIVKPPYPKVGDKVRHNEEDWHVTDVEDVGEPLSIRFPKQKGKPVTLKEERAK